MFTVAFGKGAGQNKTGNGFSHFSAMTFILQEILALQYLFIDTI